MTEAATIPVVGEAVGSSVGTFDGKDVGTIDGKDVGTIDGQGVGMPVGTHVADGTVTMKANTQEQAHSLAV